jgi:hypothetical protein
MEIPLARGQAADRSKYLLRWRTAFPTKRSHVGWESPSTPPSFTSPPFSPSSMRTVGPKRWLGLHNSVSSCSKSFLSCKLSFSRITRRPKTVAFVRQNLWKTPLAAKSPMSLLGPRTSIGNNVQRAGSSSPPRSYCRTGLQLGPARDTAHSFFARFEAPSALGGRHSRSIALSGQKMTPPVCVGAYS